MFKGQISTIYEKTVFYFDGITLPLIYSDNVITTENIYLTQDHGLVGKINYRLWDTECQRPQAGAKTSNKD